MWFVIVAHSPDPLPADWMATRQQLRPAHLARLEQLQQADRLKLAGPLLVNPDMPAEGMYGSLMVLSFNDRQALDQWLAEEPFLQAGLYSHFSVYPFVQSLPVV